MFDVVFDIARLQQGAAALWQLEPRGVGRSWLSRQCERGALRRRAPRVYVVTGAPVTRRQELVVQVLSAGPQARATADSALAVWCPELRFPDRPEVVVPPSCGVRSDAMALRRSTDLHLAKPTVLDGIPVVGVARALLDSAADHPVDDVVSRIDACQRTSPLAVGALIEALDLHRRSGRPGIAVFQQAIQQLRRTVPDSDFERMVARDLVAAGLPEPRIHHLVRLPGEDPIELDLDWPGVLFDLELDGRDHVERMRKARRDRQRDRLLQDAGYRVHRWLWDEYVADRPGMIATIVEAYLTMAGRLR